MEIAVQPLKADISPVGKRHHRELTGHRRMLANEIRQQWTVALSRMRKPRAQVAFRTDPNDDCVSRVVRAGLTWEGWLVPYLQRWCDPSSVSVDIGANIGVHAVTMARLSSYVHAFEPQRRVHAILQDNAARLSNLSAHRVALSDRTGEATMARCTDNVGATHLSRDADGERVCTATLDSMNIDRIGLMKVDVEKHERSVLIGAIETIRRDRPVILLEDQVRARSILASEGYRCHRIALFDFLCLPN